MVHLVFPFIFQILPDGEHKPQAKHLQTRADYLLKVLKKHLELEKEGVVSQINLFKTILSNLFILDGLFQS